MTSCFVYKVFRDLESMDHVCINPICRIGLIHKDLSIHVSSSRVYKLMFCKQTIMPLSLVVGTAVPDLF